MLLSHLARIGECAFVYVADISSVNITVLERTNSSLHSAKTEEVMHIINRKARLPSKLLRSGFHVRCHFRKSSALDGNIVK